MKIKKLNAMLIAFFILASTAFSPERTMAGSADADVSETDLAAESGETVVDMPDETDDMEFELPPIPDDLTFSSRL